MPQLTESQEVADYLYDLLTEKAGELGLAFIGFGDKLIPEYPAAIITAGLRQKEVHATHTFQVLLETFITVYHARLDTSHRIRTREDLALVTALENELERGEMNFPNSDGKGQVIFAYVRESAPGTITRPKGEAVVGTRMVVEVLSQKRFPYGP